MSLHQFVRYSHITGLCLSMVFTVSVTGVQAVTSELSNHSVQRRSITPRLTQRQSTVDQRRRVALIIGNGAYQTSKLPNAVNDATDFAETLRTLDFEVILLKDVSLRAMETALNDFNRKMAQGGVGLFFYAGHGMQVDGENYLIPLNAQVDRKQDVRYETLPVGKVLGAMEDAKNSVNIVILDACRQNPFRKWRSLASGLAPVTAVTGTLISYSTAPGKVALDGDAMERNSPFTKHLLKHLKDPKTAAKDIVLMLRDVRIAVREMTNGQQIPWESNSLTGLFAFNPTTAKVTSSSRPKTNSTHQLESFNQPSNQSIRTNILMAAVEKYNQGFEKWRRGDDQGAVLDLNEAIQLNPNDSDFYHIRGLAKSGLGNYQGALTDSNKAIRLNPKHPYAYNARGYINRKIGNHKAAIVDLNQAILINPKFVKPWRNRAFSRWELGDYRGAISDFTEVIRLEPNHAHSYYNRGSLKKNIKNYRGAILDYEKAAKLYKKQGNTSDYQDALEQIQKLQ